MRYGQVWHVTARCLVTAGHDGEQPGHDGEVPGMAANSQGMTAKRTFAWLAFFAFPSYICGL